MDIQANELMGVIDSASSTASAVRLQKLARRVRRSTDSSCMYSMSICGDVKAAAAAVAVEKGRSRSANG
jgi:hypothetical protein